MSFFFFSCQYKGRSTVRLGQDVLLKKAPVAQVQPFMNIREVCLRLKLPPGDYVIIPSTFEPQRQGSFILRVFTETKSPSRSDRFILRVLVLFLSFSGLLYQTEHIIIITLFTLLLPQPRLPVSSYIQEHAGSCL